jgi:hypothetical protein
MVTLRGAGTLLAAGYTFPITTVDAQPGESVRVSIKGDHELGAQGFSIAGRYDSQHLTIDRIHVDQTILDSMDAEYVEAKDSPEEGIFTVGVLLDALPPYDGRVIPVVTPTLAPLDLIHLDVTVSEDAVGFLSVRLEDGLFNPPIDNLYSVENHAVFVTEHTEGGVLVGVPFLRGDVNMDTNYDLSDPVRSLEFIFRGGLEPDCLLAADVNDDEKVDLSDSIYSLTYLFTGGDAPPPPFGAMGPDPTPGPLSCDDP